MGTVYATCSEMVDSQVNQRSQAALRVVHAPIKASFGSVLGDFSIGEEVLVLKSEKLPGLEPLRWRYERGSRKGAVITVPRKDLPPPLHYRFSVPRSFWRVKVMVRGGPGSFAQERVCLLQVAANARDRRLANVALDVQDCLAVASYAHNFNSLVYEQGLGEAAPRVQIAAPVGCEVLGSLTPQWITAEDVVLLYPYVHDDVQKFLFDGAEDFSELPHAFFHYVAYSSAGKEFAWDLQGFEDESGSVLLIDPCMMRTPAPTIVDMVGAVTPSAFSLDRGEPPISQVSPSQQRFESLHPRCTQLCRAFDPHRRGARDRGRCGVSKFACGL